jgi:hypothetical protein
MRTGYRVSGAAQSERPLTSGDAMAAIGERTAGTMSSRKGARAIHYLGAALAVTAWTGVGRADDSAAAQALFDQGKKAMAAHDYAQACPKLEESLRLEYGLGTLLNLADCYEHEGKLATAWSKFLELAAKARTAGQAERVRIGRDRAAALAPKLSNLEIDVPAASRVDGLVVQRDGTDVGSAAWGAAIPADSGPHRISASAPGRAPWSDTVTVSDGATTARVAVPLLKPLPPPPVAAAEPVAQRAAPPNGSAGSLPTTPEETPKASGGLGTPRILAIVSGVVGLAGVGVGTYFGLVSLAKHNDATNGNYCADNTCPNTSQGRSDVSASQNAVSAGNFSTIGFIVGGVGLAGAVTLWLVGSKSEQPRAMSAELGVGLGSLQLRGTWR